MTIIFDAIGGIYDYDENDASYASEVEEVHCEGCGCFVLVFDATWDIDRWLCDECYDDDEAP